MKTIQKLLLAAAAIVVSAAPAQAHRMWMLPSTFTLSGEEQWVTVDGAISNDLFFPNHVPLSLEDVTIVAPDGVVSAPEGGWTGKFRSAFDVKLDKQGTWKFAETGAMYFAQWKESGEPQRRRGSLAKLKADGVLDKDGVQLMKSGRRVETFVTLGAPSSQALQPTGKGLELVPVTHPNDIFADEEATFSFLKDGVPAAGLEVDVVKGHDRYRDDPDVMKLTTDDQGVITFTLDEPGRYWIAARAEGAAELDGKPIRAMTSYVATFEVLAP